MLSNADIRTIFHDMQQRNAILRAPNPEYVVQIQENRFMELHGYSDHVFNIHTNQLSDIHAILQLCHPNAPYYISYDIDLSENCENIPIYSYSDAPNILTGRNPTNKYNNHYIVDLSSIHINIQPNEPVVNASARFCKHAEQSLAFMQQYPNINMNPQQLDGTQKIHPTDNTEIWITAQRVHPSTIEIIMTLSSKSQCAKIGAFIIPTQHIAALADRYTTHMEHAVPNLVQYIQENFAGSQHEKMRIIRQAVPYLTHTDTPLFTYIRNCVHILLNHYTYNSPISPP